MGASRQKTIRSMRRLCSPIRLTVPAVLRYRDVVIRTVTSASGLLKDRGTSPVALRNSVALSERFDAELVSAVSEIFNNVVIHGHGRGNHDADVVVAVELRNSCIRVRISDTGEPFDLQSISRPDLKTLPEAGMGLHIARSFVDQLEYRPGPPNFWHLTKCLEREEDAGKRATARGTWHGDG